MRMVLDPVEVIGSTIGGADKVRVELDDGTELVSLHAPLEGYNDGIPCGLFLGDSLLETSYGSFCGSNDVPPKVEYLGVPIEEAGCGSDSWSIFEALIHYLGNHF